MKRLVLVALGVAFVQCGPQVPKPNVVVVTLDTTRADRFGFAGFDKAHTPNFDRFASDSTVFENTVTVAPLTLPSHTSIMTGTYPVFHGVHDNEGFVVDPTLTTLAEIMSDHGYQTAAFLGAFPLHAQFNLDQGFDLYDDDFDASDHRPGEPAPFGFLERSSNAVNERFLTWLGKHGERPFFAWVHYFDPHQAYQPQPPFDRQFATSPYDGEIATMDRSFGELIDGLNEMGKYENTIFVVVADHGEGLYEHEEATHATLIHDSTMHVPLLIRAGHSNSSKRVEAQTRTIDIAPTVLDLAGLSPHPDMQGVSLKPMLEHPDSGSLGPALIESEYSYLNHGWAPLLGIRTDHWKLIRAPTNALYNLDDDPLELVNLCQRFPSRCDQMQATLDAVVAEHAGSLRSRSAVFESDAQTSEKLQALGYVGAGFKAGRESYPEKDAIQSMTDPRDKVHLANIKSLASEKVRLKEFDQAVTVSRRWLLEDPENPSAFQYLGRAYLGLESYPEAVVALEQAIMLQPDHAEHHVLLGRAFFYQSDFARAVDSFELATRLDPTMLRAYTSLGAALSAMGRHSESLMAFETALEMDPSNWRVVFDLANVHLALGNHVKADAFFKRALALNGASAIARVYYARFLTTQDRLDEALTQLNDALFLAPDLAITHLELGVALAQNRETQALARQHLDRVLTLDATPLEKQRAQTARQMLR